MPESQGYPCQILMRVLHVGQVGGLPVKIMVADDDRDMVDMLSYWLKGHGYDVIRAFDGEQAIKRWRGTMP